MFFREMSHICIRNQLSFSDSHNGLFCFLCKSNLWNYLSDDGISTSAVD